MVNKINPIPIGQVTNNEQVAASSASTSKQTGFKDLLLKKLDKSEQPLKFSKHALERMERREIKFTDEQLKKINDFIDKAAQKGAKESVFVMDGQAMVISIDNRTVITCMDTQDAQENIFTNVDSVAFLY